MISASEARNLLLSNSRIKAEIRMVEEQVREAIKNASTSVEIPTNKLSDYTIRTIKKQGFTIEFRAYDTLNVAVISW